MYGIAISGARNRNGASNKILWDLGDMIPYNNIYGHEFEIHEHK